MKKNSESKKYNYVVISSPEEKLKLIDNLCYMQKFVTPFSFDIHDIITANVLTVCYGERIKDTEYCFIYSVERGCKRTNWISQ